MARKIKGPTTWSARRLKVPSEEQEAKRHDAGEQEPWSEGAALVPEGLRARGLRARLGADRAHEPGEVVLTEDLAARVGCELSQHAEARGIGPIARVDAPVNVDALVRGPDMHEERRNRQLLGDVVAERMRQRACLAVREDHEDPALGLGREQVVVRDRE